MPHRPLIGIAPQIVKFKNKREIVGTYRTYVQAIENAGGTTIILAPSLEQLPKYLRMVDGLLLTGGDDIHPKYFGQRPLTKNLTLSPDERTNFELAISKEFLKAKLPVLGICLGCQTLNIALGGTLIQDLPTERPEAKDHKKATHPVFIDGDSKLKKILGKNRITVNSRHHQALGKIGKGLKVTALSPDEVIEAIEVTGHPFALGFQWHPEELLQRAETKKIFLAFVRACKEPRVF